MSIFDHPDDVPAVATWRCPHCATLQPESTRCWACGRTPMTCATCRYYRRSVVGQVGFCGLDRTRALLAGDEVRPCWQAPTDLVDSRQRPARVGSHVLADPRATPTHGPCAAVGGDAGRTGGAARDTPPILAPPRAESVARGPSAALQRARAWTRDDLVEAPIVQPSRKLVSEAQRRAQARRERQLSPIDDERVL